MTTDGRPVAYTVEEAARLLGLGRSAAYEAARRGQIPTLRLGRRLRVPGWWVDRLRDGEPGEQLVSTDAPTSTDGPATRRPA